MTLPHGWQERSTELLRVLGRTAAQIPQLLSDYGWKISGIPADARRILSIGCGDGSELAVIRAAFPDVRIDAIDWECQVAPAGQIALNVTVETANFIEDLTRETRQYDAIFSNHVIEHLYHPDETLRDFRRWLAPGGALVSALPLDADPDRPFIESMLKLLQQEPPISALDLDRVDFGHPWKTNLADLRRTLQAAGYETVELFQRADHLSRFRRGTRAENLSARRRGELLCSAAFGLPRSLLKLIPGAPYPIRKSLFALESRCWFGHAQLKSLLAPEALFVANQPKLPAITSTQAP